MTSMPPTLPHQYLRDQIPNWDSEEAPYNDPLRLLASIRNRISNMREIVSTYECDTSGSFERQGYRRLKQGTEWNSVRADIRYLPTLGYYLWSSEHIVNFRKDLQRMIGMDDAAACASMFNMTPTSSQTRENLLERHQQFLEQLILLKVASRKLPTIVRHCLENHPLVKNGDEGYAVRAISSAIRMSCIDTLGNTLGRRIRLNRAPALLWHDTNLDQTLGNLDSISKSKIAAFEAEFDELVERHIRPNNRYTALPKVAMSGYIVSECASLAVQLHGAMLAKNLLRYPSSALGLCKGDVYDDNSDGIPKLKMEFDYSKVGRISLEDGLPSDDRDHSDDSDDSDDDSEDDSEDEEFDILEEPIDPAKAVRQVAAPLGSHMTFCDQLILAPLFLDSLLPSDGRFCVDVA